MAPRSLRERNEFLILRLRDLAGPSGRVPDCVLRDTAAVIGVTPRTLSSWVHTDAGIASAKGELTLTELEVQAWVMKGRVTKDFHEWLCCARGRDISLRTVQRALSRVPKAVKVYAEFGDHAQLEQCGVFTKKERPKHANDVWGLDDTYLNVPVWWDKPRLLAPAWLTATLDYATTVCPGYEVSPAREIIDLNGKPKWDRPDATVVALALAYSMAPHPNRLNPFGGVPREIRCDNALAFSSKQMEQGASRLDINLPPMRPHHPEDRGRIERFFGTMKRQLLPRLYGSDRNPVEWDGRTIKGFDPKKALTRAELIGHLEAWLDEFHHTRGADGKTPFERWQESPVAP